MYSWSRGYDYPLAQVGPFDEWQYNRDMKMETLLLSIGIVTFFQPFLGVPTTWKDALSFACGACIVVVALVVRQRARAKQSEQPEFGASLYVESRGGIERRV